MANHKWESREIKGLGALGLWVCKRCSARVFASEHHKPGKTLRVSHPDPRKPAMSCDEYAVLSVHAD